MGKTNSKQAWMSREGPEGDCVIENDTTNTALDFPEDEVVTEKSIYTAEYTYKGYPVNLEVPYEYDSKEKEAANKKGFYLDYPIEVVELPDEPDGKTYDDVFKREGVVEAATQTKPAKELAECGLSVKSTGSDQEWSYTLYDFEGQGKVTREDIKNLVKSIYDVLGKNINQSRNTHRDPLKKLRVRLSVSKEHGKDTSDGVSTRHEYVLSACGTQTPKRIRAKSLPIERVDSMKVNPPTSSECLNNPLRQSRALCDPPVGMENNENVTTPPRRTKSSCKRCEQRRAERQSRHRERSASAHKATGTQATAKNPAMYHYPKRLQTGPGECEPTPGGSPQADRDMSRVQDWINQWCTPVDGTEHERGKESSHRHKHRSHHKQTEKDDVACKLHHCSQYLDLATNPVTSPYHVDNQPYTYLNPSPRPRHSNKQNGQQQQSACKHHCKCQQEQHQPAVHRHEHHHHHSHHHYHHYVS